MSITVEPMGIAASTKEKRDAILVTYGSKGSRMVIP